ncbi:MAG: hypothetical protein U5L96_18125 [Owenweeksia sp.]|nr:hypothetical protein [Owenweeksia sp.]
MKYLYYLYFAISFLLIHSKGISQQLSPVSLPLYENFEDASGVFSSDSICVYCDSTIRFDTYFSQIGFQSLYNISFNQGYSNTTIGASDTGSALFLGDGTVNTLRATINMSNYDTGNVNTILLNFFQFDHYDEADPEDVVKIRGTDTANWILVYDLGKGGVDGQWTKAANINITKALIANNQNFSSTFQIQFSQRDSDFSIQADGRSIDDILLEEVFCVPPFEPDVVTGSDTSLYLSWHKAAPQSATEVWYGVEGFRNSGLPGKKLILNASDSLVLDSLISNTCYDIYIRHICGPNNSSKWVGPLNACTNCSLIQAPYFLDFDNLTTGDQGNLGNCWRTYKADSSDYVSANSVFYIFKVNRGNGPSTAIGPYSDAGPGPGNYIMAEGNTISPNDSTHLALNTRIDLSNIPNPELRFSYHIFSSLGNNLLVAQIDSGTGWHNLARINAPQQSGPAGKWRDTILSLNAYKGAIDIRFVSSSNYQVVYVALDSRHATSRLPAQNRSYSPFKGEVLLLHGLLMNH